MERQEVMTEYVLGFLFDPEGSQVALINKLKPAWQASRLNGVGGKIEPGEEPWEAMVREFKEEADLLVTDWVYFGVMGGDNWKVHLFTCVSFNTAYIISNTAEEVKMVDCRWEGLYDKKRAISNVPWLILAAKDALFNGSGPKSITINY